MYGKTKYLKMTEKKYWLKGRRKMKWSKM
uniref:Uncharacterized protein n=1 Tax=Tetranychus urticae TaxID=32264 RepID=T1JYX1_TETUR